MERKSANFREQFVDESLWQGLGVIDQDELAAKFFLGVADKRRNWNLEVPPTDFHECAETLLHVDDPTGCAFADIYQIGRASCRERVLQYVSISVVADRLKKKQ